jgi:hypothetical protein
LEDTEFEEFQAYFYKSVREIYLDHNENVLNSPCFNNYLNALAYMATFQKVFALEELE